MRNALREGVLSNAGTGAAHARTLPHSTIRFRFAEIWRRLLNSDQIGVDDDFFEAGGDSLLAEQMLLEVEGVLDREVPTSRLSEASTICGLTGIAIAASKGNRGQELLTKARDAPGTPFFFCHGDFGGRGFYALKLARLIDPPQSLYLVHPLPDLAERKTDLTLEDMARLYVPLLLAERPEGSFRLGGHCNGGLLALEIAHQLTKLGRKVELVLLIEAFSLNCRSSLRLLNRLMQGLGAVVPSGKFRRRLDELVMPFVWSRLHYGFDPVRAKWRQFGREDSGFPEPRELEERAYLRVMANYVPPKLDSTIIAVTAEDKTSDRSVRPDLWESCAELSCKRGFPAHIWAASPLRWTRSQNASARF